MKDSYAKNVARKSRHKKKPAETIARTASTPFMLTTRTRAIAHLNVTDLWNLSDWNIKEKKDIK